MIALSIEPELMEDAVLCAERAAAPALVRMFRRERNPIYEIRDDESREDAFRALARTWFDRFGLRATLQSAIDEHAMLDDRVSGCRIVRAAGRSAEGADLLDPVLEQGTSRPLLVLRLTAESLLAPDYLRPLLRHELMHVTDMLDSCFGYQRVLPKSDDGPSADNILRDRYRVVWDVTIDGRLTRAGHAPGPARDRRWCEFSTAFAALGAECPDAFEYWWSETHPTHAALLAFATAPAGSAAAHGTGRCPFCHFPVASLDSRVSTMAVPVAAALRAEHPSWRIEQGICSQCFDLYEARYGHADLAAR
jgi:hypothetical protein